MLQKRFTMALRKMGRKAAVNKLFKNKQILIHFWKLLFVSETRFISKTCVVTKLMCSKLLLIAFNYSEKFLMKQLENR